MQALFLTQTDARGASARLRAYQFLGPLARRGIAAEVWPLPLGNVTASRAALRAPLHLLHAARRVLDVPRVRCFDALVIQRDLVAHLHPWIETAMARVNPRIVLDLDDPIHLHPPGRPPALPFRWLWDREKLPRLVRLARQVVVANRFLRDEVARLGVESILVPTSIDTNRWTPGEAPAARPFVMGWIGSPGTTAYLASIAPALERVAREIPCVLRAVGADERLPARLAGPAPSLAVEAIPWSEATEVARVRQFHAGLMPLTRDRWSEGKSATKLLQYMACGVPAIASPVGANRDIVKDGVNGLLAEDEGRWVEALLALARDRRFGERIGREGRATVVAEYDVEVSAPKLAEAIRRAAGAEA